MKKILLSSLLLSTSVDVVITDTHSLSVVRQKILRITGI